MLDLSIFLRRFREFGGWRLVKEYAGLGLIPAIVKNFCRCILKGQSLKAIYPAVRGKVSPMLVKRYKPIIAESRRRYETMELPHEHPKIVWWSWLQGLDNAPDVVKACLRSLQENLPKDYEIRVIDEHNWKEWVTLPQYIVDKRSAGRIPAALFSDLLRLELLIKYGGTWIDATVLCTGVGSRESREGKESRESARLLEADLFLFQYTTPEGGPFKGISNWFISAHSNNKVLMTLRDMLMAYWRDYDCTLDYYIFHLFFWGMVKAYPKEIAEMPYAYSGDALLLMNHWGEEYDELKWKCLTSKNRFHKLSARPRKAMTDNTIDSIYRRIVNILF